MDCAPFLLVVVGVEWADIIAIFINKIYSANIGLFSSILVSKYPRNRPVSLKFNRLRRLVTDASLLVDGGLIVVGQGRLHWANQEITCFESQAGQAGVRRHLFKHVLGGPLEVNAIVADLLTPHWHLAKSEVAVRGSWYPSRQECVYSCILRLEYTSQLFLDPRGFLFRPLKIPIPEVSIALQQLFQLAISQCQAAEIVLLILLKQALAILLIVQVGANFGFEAIKLYVDVTQIRENICLQRSEVHDWLLRLRNDSLWDGSRFIHHKFIMLLSQREHLSWRVVRQWLDHVLC